MTRVELTARWRRRRLLRAGVTIVALVLAAAAIAVDVPRQYERFRSTEVTVVAVNDQRARLGDASATGRVEFWRVAYGQFERTPVRGSGAGTFELAWDQRRPVFSRVRDGHPLYLEVLGELGLIGLALIAVVILTILVGVALRMRGPNRATYAMVFAACLAWAIAVGIDWHWEVAVVTLWFFAVGGAALARDGAEPSWRIPPLWQRGVIAGACCVIALLAPLRVAVSQDRLKASANAFLVGQCDTAGAAARDALRAIGSRPQAYEVMAYCALVDGDRAPAFRRMEQAVRRDPANWRLRYGLPRMQAMAGRDPRRAAREALRLNPLEPLTRDAVMRFAGAQRPAQWSVRRRG